MRKKQTTDLTAQYLSHSSGTNLATGQTGKGHSTQGNPIRHEPLPLSPQQVQADHSDADKVGPAIRKRIRQAPANARTGAIAVSASADQILENPKNKKAIQDAHEGIEQTRTFLDNVKGRKGPKKEVGKKLDAYEDALKGVEKGKFGAKRKLERAKSELDRSARKLR